MEKKLNKNLIGLAALLAVVAIGATALYSGLIGNFASVPSLSEGELGEEMDYGSMVCVYHNGDLVYCKPNTLTNLGKNMTRDRLTYLSGVAVNYIGVGNSTEVNVSSPSLEGEISDCGMDRAQDTTRLDIATGNWSYNYKFVSTCSNFVVNTTGLFNHTSENSGFLAGSTFSSGVTLQSSDELNVTWYVWVT